jgi:hypothetical protein
LGRLYFRVHYEALKNIAEKSELTLTFR